MRQRTYLLDQLAGLVIFSTDRPGQESCSPNIVHYTTRQFLADLAPVSGQWDGAEERGWIGRPTPSAPIPDSLGWPPSVAYVARQLALMFDQDAVLLHDPAPYGPFGRGAWRLVNAAGTDLAAPVAFESVEFIPPGSAENHTTLALGVAGPVSFRIPFEVAT